MTKEINTILNTNSEGKKSHGNLSLDRKISNIKARLDTLKTGKI